MRKSIAIVLILLLTSALTSCYDAKEIDDVNHVILIGIDKGVSNSLRLTLQFPSEKGSMGGIDMSSGSSQKSNENINATVDAPSLAEGINMLNMSLPRQLSFTHTNLIVISEEVAKEGIKKYIAEVMRYREIRMSSHVIIVKDKAMDFINELKPVIGSTVAKDIETIVVLSESTGYFPHSTLYDVNNCLESTSHQGMIMMGAINKFEAFKENGEPYVTEFKSGGSYVAGQIPRISDNKIEFWGAALFNGDKMVGELNGDETRFLLMIRDEFQNGNFSLPDPKNPEMIVSFEVMLNGSPDIKVTIQDGKPVIDLDFKFSAELLAVQNNVGYEKPDLKVILEKELSNYVLMNMEKLIKKCIDLNVDVFDFGDYAARGFLTIEKFEEYNWNDNFKNSTVNISVETLIRRTGTQISS